MIFFFGIIKTMKKHVFWVAEVFIWVLILFAVSGVLMLTKYNHNKFLNTYQIFLPDVDGLINGSPVRLMGIQIGYVNQLSIVGDNVYVRFVVTEPNVKLPHGVIATVEFSGLGGSKSLELYTPTKNTPKSDKLIIAQSPKRIHDSLGLLNDMFNKLMGLTYSVSHFMDEMGVIKKSSPEQIKSADGFIETSNDWLDKMQKQSDNFNNKIQKINGKKANNKGNGNENNVRETNNSN